MSYAKYGCLKSRNPRPLLIVIMDGIGYREEKEGNAVANALTPHLDWFMANCPWTLLKAHGTAVGLPSDKDMGNSEVGHNAIGAGRVYPQGAKLVNESIASGKIFQGKTWRWLVDFCREHNGKFHFIGLLSDGNVHSHIDQLKAMLEHLACEDKIPVARVHILLDGRDVEETSALRYVDDLEEFLAKINKNCSVDYRIASGGGRMTTTMDRYEANWEIVATGWRTHVKGEGRSFKFAREAIETYRKEIPGIIDQDLPPFVIVDENGPVGKIEDGDSVVFFNFRGDRAIEISRAFEEENFDKFDRGPLPKIAYAGMMEYDGDLHIPRHYLVEPPHIEKTMGELLCQRGITQLAISETQKFGHVTYFWNGNRSGKFDEKLETYIEIPSDIVPFELRPWMKSAEITDRTLEEMSTGKYDLVRMNYANGDMVGHTGIYQAAVIGVESVDLAVGRLKKWVTENEAIAIITADHGNADEMFELDKKTKEVLRDKDGNPRAKTSHTLNPVPFIIYDPGFNGEYRFNPEIENRGLSNIAATCFQLLGFEPPDFYDPPLLIFDSK